MDQQFILSVKATNYRLVAFTTVLFKLQKNLPESVSSARSDESTVRSKTFVRQIRSFLSEIFGQKPIF